MKVGLVTDVGGLNDRGFNQLVVRRACSAPSGSSASPRRSSSRSRRGEYVPNLSTFARQGYDLTIGVGFTEAQAVDTAATKFPDSNFAIVDVDQTEEPHKPANLLGLLFKEQETGYLVGYLAGLEEKRRPGQDVIGSVGGQKQPPVDRFIAGYQAGAKAAAPGIKVLNSYSQDFNDQAKCKQIALNQIEAGAGVVFRSPAAAGSERSTRRRRRTSGGSASTPTSPSSVRTSSRVRSSASTRRSSSRSRASSTASSRAGT